MTERWLPVVGYEGQYQVSDRGRVRGVDRYVPTKGGALRFQRGQILKPDRHVRGKLQVSLSGRRHAVAHLVLEAFVGPRPPGLEACHWDDDPGNNVPSNLRWNTSSSNKRDAVRNRRGQSSKTVCSHGHEYTAENTYYRPGGGRDCRECKRVNQRKYDARRRAR